MKRFAFSTLFAIFAVMLVSGCQEPEDPTNVNYQLSVNPTSLAFSAVGGSQEFRIKTDAPSCKVDVRENWLSATLSGDVVTVTASANTSTDSRDAIITVSAGNSKAEVSVMQGGKTSRPADDPYPNAQYGLADNSIFVKPDYSKGITAADPAGSTFTVPSSAVGDQKPEKGQKLIMNTPTDLFPNGLLAEVVSVKENGGNYEVAYKDLKLEEAFSSLHIDETPVELNVLEVQDAKGNKVPFVQTKSSSKETYHLELPAASWPLDYAGLEVAPILELDLTLFFQAIVEGMSLYSLNFDTKVDLTIGATVACGLEGKAIDERYPIYFVVCGAVPVGPILITPTISIDALLEASGKVSVEATTKLKASRRYGVHYDANAGWTTNDYPDINKSGSLTVENVSPKVEGTIAYGFSVGPTIAIYAKAVTAGVGYDVKTKNTLSGAFDLLHGNVADYLNWNLVQHLQNADFAITDTESFSVYGSVLTREVLSKSTPDITVNEKKWKVLPKLGSFPTFERTDEGLELTVWVKNRNLLNGQLSARVAEHPKDLENIRKMVFPDSQQIIESLNSDEKPDSVALKGFVHLDEEDPDLNYADFLLDVSGYGVFSLGSFMQEFNDEAVRVALMDILRDLYASKAPDATWEDCNWFEKDIPVYSLKGVRVSRRGEQFFFRINLKSSWKLGPTVTVNEHSNGIPAFGGWELIIEDGAGSGLESLHFFDTHFTGYWLKSDDNHLDQLTINSPIWNRMEDLGSGIRQFNKLDLSNTPIEALEFKSGGITVKENLVLKNCKSLKNLKFSLFVPKQYDVTGCDALEEILFDSILFPVAYFTPKTTGTPGANLVIEQSTLGSLEFPQNFNEVFIRKSSFDQVEVIGNGSMKYIDFKESKGNSITVKDCAKMGALDCANTNISYFEVKNLPAMNHIDVAENMKLLRVVPDVFDQIQDNGGSVNYDIRYEYQDDGSGTILYTDNGFGFWYEGEPECGYHGKVPPQEDDEGYVLRPGETAARTAFRKVLQDLYRCRKGEWEGCDWLDGSKRLDELMNVTAPENASNNETYSVVIPEEWQFGADVVVKKHNKQATEQYGGEAGHYEDWQLIIKGERSYNTFSISDPRCYLIQAPGEAKTFAVHSPSFFFNPRGEEPWKYRSHVIPSKIHTLDFRGSGGYDFDYKVDYEHTPKVFLLRRYDGKNLNQGLMISVKYSDATPQPMPSITIGPNDDGSEGGKWIKLSNMILPYGDLPIKVDYMATLELYGCVGDMVYMPQNISYLSAGYAYDSSGNYMPFASGVADIKEIKVLDNRTIKGIHARVQDAVTVSSCPSLTTASFDSAPITRFDMDGVPKLSYLNLKDCTKLMKEVPALFEQEGLTVDYEERYEYTYGDGPYTTAKGTKFNYSDKGYGFWYKGEPQQGYHKNPR